MYNPLVIEVSDSSGSSKTQFKRMSHGVSNQYHRHKQGQRMKRTEQATVPRIAGGEVPKNTHTSSTYQIATRNKKKLD